MLKRIAIISALSIAAGAALAQTDANIARKFELKDGSTVIIFKDGKMSMQDKLGRTAAMKPGHVMETKDGQRIIMIGNEIARLESVMATERGGK